jgi:regulator of cell morphogenesis and NO signaling
MDYCCGGGETLGQACQIRAVDLRELLLALDSLSEGSGGPGTQPVDWPLDVLIDHIVSTHHEYAKATLPVLAARTAKIAAVHGERSPALRGVAGHFAHVAEGMTLHMQKEEQVLFPYIRALVEADRAGRRIGGSPFGTVLNPIRMMKVEHRDAGDEMRVIRDLTDGYALPDFACTTYRACFAELQAFERDLHRHVHLENNVLFPGAVALEDRLA